MAARAPDLVRSYNIQFTASSQIVDLFDRIPDGFAYHLKGIALTTGTNPANVDGAFHLGLFRQPDQAGLAPGLYALQPTLLWHRAYAFHFLTSGNAVNPSPEWELAPFNWRFAQKCSLLYVRNFQADHQFDLQVRYQVERVSLAERNDILVWQGGPVT